MGGRPKSEKRVLVKDSCQHRKEHIVVMRRNERDMQVKSGEDNIWSMEIASMYEMCKIEQAQNVGLGPGQFKDTGRVVKDIL